MAQELLGSAIMNLEATEPKTVADWRDLARALCDKALLANDSRITKTPILQ